MARFTPDMAAATALGADHDGTGLRAAGAGSIAAPCARSCRRLVDPAFDRVPDPACDGLNAAGERLLRDGAATILRDMEVGRMGAGRDEIGHRQHRRPARGAARDRDGAGRGGAGRGARASQATRTDDTIRSWRNGMESLPGSRTRRSEPPPRASNFCGTIRQAPKSLIRPGSMSGPVNAAHAEARLMRNRLLPALLAGRRSRNGHRRAGGDPEGRLGMESNERGRGSEARDRQRERRPSRIAQGAQARHRDAAMRAPDGAAPAPVIATIRVSPAAGAMPSTDREARSIDAHRHDLRPEARTRRKTRWRDGRERGRECRRPRAHAGVAGPVDVGAARDPAGAARHEDEVRFHGDVADSVADEVADPAGADGARPRTMWPISRRT